MAITRCKEQISKSIPPLFSPVQDKLLYLDLWEHVIEKGFKICGLNYEFDEEITLPYDNAQPFLNFGFI